MGGALLFAASLGYFLYRYAVDLGRPLTGIDWVGPFTSNVAMFTAFALHHSLFARTPVRSFISRHLPPPLERSLYVWIASALFLAVCAGWRPVPGVAWTLNGAGRWLLWGLQAAGLIVTLRGAAVLNVRELAGLVAQPGGDAAEPHATSFEFKTAWPYGWVRHPIYAGWFLLVLPSTPMTMTRLTFAAISCLYLLVAMPLEEATLRRTTGEAYARYQQQVRWRIFPWIY